MELKWSPKVDKIVGININDFDKKMYLHQHILVNQLVDGYSRNAYPHRCTLPEGELSTNDSNTVDQTAYFSVLWSLMYLCRGTRPELLYAVNLLARYSTNPSATHWDALDVLMGYVKRTRDL